ncbi:UNVERIFIED_CONTAM: hypothetical protein FKN15_000500 [Acipenser sinensis]
MAISMCKTDDVKQVLSMIHKNLQCPIWLCMLNLLSRKKGGLAECPLCKSDVTKRAEESGFNQAQANGKKTNVEAKSWERGCDGTNDIPSNRQIELEMVSSTAVYTGSVLPKKASEQSSYGELWKSDGTIQSTGHRNRTKKKTASNGMRENLEGQLTIEDSDVVVRKVSQRNKRLKLESAVPLCIEIDSSEEELFKKKDINGAEESGFNQAQANGKKTNVEAKSWERGCDGTNDIPSNRQIELEMVSSTADDLDSHQTTSCSQGEDQNTACQYQLLKGLITRATFVDGNKGVTDVADLSSWQFNQKELEDQPNTPQRIENKVGGLSGRKGAIENSSPPATCSTLSAGGMPAPISAVSRSRLTPGIEDPNGPVDGNRKQSPLKVPTPLESAANTGGAKRPVLRRKMSLVASGLNKSELMLVQEFAKKIQVTLSSQVTPGTTHIIMKTGPLHNSWMSCAWLIRTCSGGGCGMQKGAPREVQDVPYSLEIAGSNPGYVTTDCDREFLGGGAQLAERCPGRVGLGRQGNPWLTAHKQPLWPIGCLWFCSGAARSVLSSDTIGLVALLWICGAKNDGLAGARFGGRVFQTPFP